MAKSLLHKELQMFPDVPVRKKTRIQNILEDIGINSLEDLGYEESYGDVVLIVLVKQPLLKWEFN